ncbi:MAG: hypothetical protein LBC37_04145 [Zoogloeaceae bacterium]|jgi:hypothetical protein|nr:hypothetical protein [Zoogloeaceae bacterium]
MKNAFLLFFFGIAFCFPALAEPPLEPTLGRLFYTPAERAAMEAQKMNGMDAPEAAMPYQGLVVRQNTGAITVWQEDEAQELPPQTDGAQIGRNVGGTQEELLRGGRIVTHPGK